MTVTIQVRNHRKALDANYILLLTSNSVERAAVNEVLRNICNADVGRDTKGCNIGLLGRRLVIHVSGESGISRRLSIGRIAGNLLGDSSFPSPALMLLIGFCWGNPNKTRAETVIVSPHVVSLNETHETPSGSERVARHHQSSVELSPSFIQSLQKRLAAHAISALSGPIGSLETLYKNSDSRDALISKFPELQGAEMEAFALLPSDLPWMVVKAVSDFGGDDVDRVQQRSAAQRAALSALTLVTLLDEDGILQKQQVGPDQKLLEDLITGNALRVDVRELAANGLNDLLNNEIGGPLLYKLGRYVSVIEYDTEFPALMCAMILEVMQNAIKHGRASRTTVTLYPTKIIIEDDGEPFDPSTLTGSNGGAHDWRAVEHRYLVNGDIKFTSKLASARRGNQYVLALPRATNVLRDAKQNCSMQVVSHVIGAPYGNESALAFDEKCRILYYYADNLRMTSRRNSIADSIRTVVESGRKVYVGCPSGPDVVYFKEKLRDIIGENLVVFADAVR